MPVTHWGGQQPTGLGALAIPICCCKPGSFLESQRSLVHDGNLETVTLISVMEPTIVMARVSHLRGERGGQADKGPAQFLCHAFLIWTVSGRCHSQWRRFFPSTKAIRTVLRVGLCSGDSSSWKVDIKTNHDTGLFATKLSFQPLRLINDNFSNFGTGVKILKHFYYYLCIQVFFSFWGW